MARSTRSTSVLLALQQMIKRGPAPDAASHIGRTDNAMTKIALTKAPTSLLECAVYISARKKLIHAMSLDIDRPIARAVVVKCAVSATRNNLKLLMSRTLKSTLAQPSCQNAEVVEAFCRVAASRSNTRRSIHQPSIAALHAPAEMPTALFSVLLLCRHCTPPRARVALTIESGTGIKPR